MKRLILVIAVATLFSCNNNENKTPATNIKDSVVTKKTNTDDNPTQEKILENEFKNFITVLTSKDKDKIKQLFKFPVADSILNIYLDYAHTISDAKGVITEEAFLKNFDKVCKFWMVDEFASSFKAMQLDSLSQGKEIFYEEPSDKIQPCYKHCSLIFKNDILHFTYGINRNPNFNNKVKPGNGEDENVCDETSIIWEFKFDGKKLVFIRQLAAG
ncbi:MAG: hypothetical protein IPJ81_15300 [Chitinophagaceae bacterium]|nr:hypothetical protein [Chitinophagaceae bacterium]